MVLTSSAENSDLRMRKSLARMQLAENQLEDAVKAYSGILRDYPDDVETLLLLGNLYLASGNGRTAERLFRQAQKIDPENRTIENRIRLAMQPSERLLAEEPVPTDPDAVARLLARLTGRPVVLEDEMMRAAEMLQRILESPDPYQEIEAALDDIGALLPALIELNIRQAYADGRAEIAKALQEIQFNIALQQNARAGAAESPCVNEPAVVAEPQPAFQGNVLLLLPGSEPNSERMEVLCRSLDAAGCQVTVSEQFQPGAANHPDVVIASNPHLMPKLVDSLAVCAAANVPIIVDLDMDFENLPVNHPLYAEKGLGQIEAARAYTAALRLSTMITVASETHAGFLKGEGRPVAVIPEGWSRSNSLWTKDQPVRRTVNLGIFGIEATLEDIALIRRAVIRVLREFERAQLILIGNQPAYRLFDGVPENRRLFVPAYSTTEAPYLLSQIDLLLLPFRSVPFNQSQSDRLLVQAGVKRIPWIASPFPAAVAWQAGGMIARSQDEWHDLLRHLTMDGEYRRDLQEEGFAAAVQREAEHIGPKWLQVIGQSAHLHAGALG